MPKFNYAALENSSQRVRAFNGLWNTALDFGWKHPTVLNNRWLYADDAVEFLIANDKLGDVIRAENVGKKTAAVLLEFYADNGLNVKQPSD